MSLFLPFLFFSFLFFYCILVEFTISSYTISKARVKIINLLEIKTNFIFRLFEIRSRNEKMSKVATFSRSGACALLKLMPLRIHWKDNGRKCVSLFASLAVCDGYLCVCVGKTSSIKLSSLPTTIKYCSNNENKLGMLPKWLQKHLKTPKHCDGNWIGRRFRRRRRHDTMAKIFMTIELNTYGLAFKLDERDKFGLEFHFATVRKRENN